MAFKVKAELGHYDLRILIGGYPAVYIPRKGFSGFASWNDDDAFFGIDFYVNKSVIKTKWDTREKWLAVLKALNDKL